MLEKSLIELTIIRKLTYESCFGTIYIEIYNKTGLLVKEKSSRVRHLNCCGKYLHDAV